MNPVIKWFLDRAKERSTWLGLVSLGVAGGLNLSPELVDKIVLSGIAMAGLITTLFPQPTTPPKE